jgi:hypothetical protein
LFVREYKKNQKPHKINYIDKTNKLVELKNGIKVSIFVVLPEFFAFKRCWGENSI